MEKNRRIPIRMKYPNPPWPISDVTVTRPVVLMVAIRTPAMIAASASWSSTRHNRSRGV